MMLMGRYLEEECGSIGAETLDDLRGMESEAAMSDKKHATGVQRCVEELR
jgi:hypothetical protein